MLGDFREVGKKSPETGKSEMTLKMVTNYERATVAAAQTRWRVHGSEIGRHPAKSRRTHGDVAGYPCRDRATPWLLCSVAKAKEMR